MYKAEDAAKIRTPGKREREGPIVWSSRSDSSTSKSRTTVAMHVRQVASQSASIRVLQSVAHHRAQRLETPARFIKQRSRLVAYRTLGCGSKHSLSPSFCHSRCASDRSMCVAPFIVIHKYVSLACLSPSICGYVCLSAEVARVDQRL